MGTRRPPVVRVGDTSAVIPPDQVAALTALHRGGLLDGAALLALEPNTDDETLRQQAS